MNAKYPKPLILSIPRSHEMRIYHHWSMMRGHAKGIEAGVPHQISISINLLFRPTSRV